MEDFSVSVAIKGLIGISLIIAGSHLMMFTAKVVRGFGAFCFAFGYLILGLAVSCNDIDGFDSGNRRLMIGLGSAVAIVAGTFLTYYHVHEYLKSMAGNNGGIVSNVLDIIPLLDSVLLYGGLAGLVFTIAVNNDGEINFIKGGLAVAAVIALGYSGRKMIESSVTGVGVDKYQMAHLASWGLMVVAIGYGCH